MMEDQYEEQTIQQQRGPTIRFTGKLLAETEFETRGRDPMRVTFEIWETPGGALVAVSQTEPAEREGHVSANVLVVEDRSDEQAARFAVMDHFDWHDRARSMVGKQLKWKLVREVA